MGTQLFRDRSERYLGNFTGRVSQVEYTLLCSDIPGGFKLSAEYTNSQGKTREGGFFKATIDPEINQGLLKFLFLPKRIGAHQIVTTKFKSKVTRGGIASNLFKIGMPLLAAQRKVHVTAFTQEGLRALHSRYVSLNYAPRTNWIK